MERNYLMTNELKEYVDQAHINACEKGFWRDYNPYNPDKRKNLMLIITEISEAVEADRINKRFDYDGYLRELAANDFNIAVSVFFKATVEEELADICIRLFDFIGGFGIKLPTVWRYYQIELESWYQRPIKDFPEFMLAITRDVTDVFYMPHSSNYLGSALGKVFAIAHEMNIDLKKCIEIKMKYNKSREIGHGKAY